MGSLTYIKYFVLVLLVTYSLQGILFSPDLIVGKIAILFLLGIHFIFFFSSLTSKNELVVNALYILVMLNTLYYLFSNESFINSGNTVGLGINQVDTFSAIKDILFNLLSFFTAYYISVKRNTNDKQIVGFFLVFFLISIFNYYETANTISLATGREEFTNNAGYRFVQLLPFLFLIRNKLVSSIFLFISLAFIMFAAKRGAIITGTLFTLLYIYSSYLKNSGSKLFSRLLVAALFLFSASAVVYNIYLDNDYLQLRMEGTLEGDSSGRDSMYSQLWQYWLNANSSILDLLFGFGFAASVEITGLFAHNDWLELLTMSGILGVVIYLLFFIQLILFSRKKFLMPADKYILQSIILVWFFKSLFSMGYNDYSMFTLVMLLGYIVGKYHRFYQKIPKLTNFSASQKVFKSDLSK